jgi:hypothetical protein
MGGYAVSKTMSEAELKIELDVLLAKAGVVVPEDRLQAVFMGFQDLKRLTALLRQPRSAAAEPSNIFSLVTLMKGA